MFDIIAPLFLEIYKTTGLNFVTFYDPYEYGRFISGAGKSLQLMFYTLCLSLIIGVFGAQAQTSKSKILRGGVEVYVQAFRNTPVMIQLLFFYFAIGGIGPVIDAGGYYKPLIPAFGWAVIAIGLFGGAYNVEIFRSGIEAVPASTTQAAKSLGMNKWQVFSRITLPLAFRVSFPSLGTNLISLAKTTSFAYVIAVPEVTYMLNQIWADNVNVPEMIFLLFLFYFIVITALSFFLNWIENRITIPGVGK